ncbi:hypothetical protein FHX52_3328 [Humibacillus xanthopallidus]|uniref:Uncharacterized protein n=1 Tax=Humibacillus xanthopallidus TaxID=412689 RepID=A0A543PRA4_9MICO|nr:hypothetical protein FHX52_3328 [Humibacillus xanthopallidus]
MAIGSRASSGTCQCTAPRSLLAHELGDRDLGKLVVAPGCLVSQRREPAHDPADGGCGVATLDRAASAPPARSKEQSVGRGSADELLSRFQGPDRKSSSSARKPEDAVHSRSRGDLTAYAWGVITHPRLRRAQRQPPGIPYAAASLPIERAVRRAGACRPTALSIPGSRSKEQFVGRGACRRTALSIGKLGGSEDCAAAGDPDDGAGDVAGVGRGRDEDIGRGDLGRLAGAAQQVDGEVVESGLGRRVVEQLRRRVIRLGRRRQGDLTDEPIPPAELAPSA